MQTQNRLNTASFPEQRNTPSLVSTTLPQPFPQPEAPPLSIITCVCRLCLRSAIVVYFGLVCTTSLLTCGVVSAHPDVYS